MREYNVHEVLAILQKYYITKCPQMVTRWIREGKINGTRGANRREGYRVLEEDLFEFIEEERPGLPAVMETYNEYIKNLNPEQEGGKNDHPKSKKNVNADESEEVEENIINQLQRRILHLENTILELQEEKQIIEMDMIEALESKIKLEKKLEKLQEENKTCIDLYNMVDEENMQLKERSMIGVTDSNEEDISSKSKNQFVEKTSNSPVTFEEYKNIGNDMISKLEPSIKPLVTDDHLRRIYDQIFHEGLLKSELVTGDGTMKCPITQKLYKQQKRLINNVTRYYLEKLSKQKENEEELV